MDLIKSLTEQFRLKAYQIENVIALIDEGNTIPFIARYRKEAHGSLDDQILREISERLSYLRGLEQRRQEVRGLIEALGAMTDELEHTLANAVTLAEIDDIYRPYRPKRKTRASVAREKGLEPLAMAIFSQDQTCLHTPLELAGDYLREEHGIHTAQDALSGAIDIIAEIISDDAGTRKRLRQYTMAWGLICSKGVDPQNDSVYAQYYDFQEPVCKVAGHRILAIDRGEREELLKVSIVVDKQKALGIVHSASVKQGSLCAEVVRTAADDAYDRLIFPSIEREIRSTLTESAAEKAIKVFAQNLRHLLMQPPVKGRVVMGLDPGYRTGCKVAVVDSTGRVLDTGVIYPTHSRTKVEEAEKFVMQLIKKHAINVVSIGNGTASKETEAFLAELIKSEELDVSYMVVSEAGASVYSASKLAAEEFPEFDVTLRSAVSIARRLQDPLAELVKIDPKAIGVGQYQHDMPKKQLDEALVGVVEDCVNNVGVDLNTASPSLLARVSGVSRVVSKNIVAYREENGEFKCRSELKKVAKLGPKAYEQCAGFLRVPESREVLDNTAVHPESYSAAKKLLEKCGLTKSDVKSAKIKELPSKVIELGYDGLSCAIGVGVPTLTDIVQELLRPGRDPRDELPVPILRKDILDIKDLRVGMELDGTVRNVIDFGAFVDIGVHQDGLVHISEISDTYIKHPGDVLKVGDIVKVKVIGVDVAKNRISLTIKTAGSQDSNS